MKSYSSSPFDRDFLTLWKELISYLSLSYTLLAAEPKAFDKIKSLGKHVEPKHLPLDHPFLAEYEEFMLMFDHGIDSFQSNLADITTYDPADYEYWSKNKEIEDADVVYRELMNAQGALHSTHDQFLKFREIISNRSEVVKKQ